MNAIFIAKIMGSSRKFAKGLTNHPPKNTRTVKALIRIIDPYSARKKRAKPILEYSTLNPETNSDSASGKSKGALFVSAKILTKNIKKSGKKGIIKKTNIWKETILTKLRDPTQSKVTTSIRPNETSYEIICPALRIAPKKACPKACDKVPSGS